MKIKNIPTILVVFGATGDLMKKKIVPAIFQLFKQDKLPLLFNIVGFSRRNLSQDQFKKHISDILVVHDLEIKKELLSKFIKHFIYQQGDFNSSASYQNLAKILGRIDGEWKVCSNKLFYLATPPKYNETIFKNLASSGLTLPCSSEEGWTRVIVEKPFGHDLKTAEELDTLLGHLFKEEQIYRIDHYLGKDMLQNILSFRFSNNILEQSWSNKYIEKIEIRLLEKLGVEKRGVFYDGLGALRDVGQNHLLQMLALVTMNNPGLFTAQKVRIKRSQILNTLHVPNSSEIKSKTFRAQYEGYRKIKGVKIASNTETYFKVMAYLKSSRWQGVPIFMESGKKMKEQIKEIVVTFKHPTPCFCPPGKHFHNQIGFQLEPKENIQIRVLAKTPGLKMEVEERNFDLIYRERKGNSQYVEEYVKLLLDCIEGNQLLFISTKEIKAMWRYIDPIIYAWDENLAPLQFYKPDTDNIIRESSSFIETQSVKPILRKELGIVGLGKMGANISRQLLEKGWRVSGYNRSPEDTKQMEQEGLIGSYSVQELVKKSESPKIIWIMLPAGKIIDQIIFAKDGLIDLLNKGDIIIDAGNSYYKDSVRRARKLAQKGIRFLDVGISGGPAGARYGASLMVGGDRKTYEYLLPLFVDIAVPSGVQFFAGAGAGHFVKMIHNGIEYGMMQAIAEGFTVLEKTKYKLNLNKVADIYNHGSVIESRLIGWLEEAYEIYSDDLKKITGVVRHTGEGEWTVKTAHELKIKTKIIEEALRFRIKSEKKPSYTGKILTALRNRFGGHEIK